MKRKLTSIHRFLLTSTWLHLSGSISSGQAHVLPPLGVGKQRNEHPPLFLAQALLTIMVHKVWLLYISCSIWALVVFGNVQA